MSEVITILEPSRARRLVTIALLGFMGLLLLYLTITQTPQSLWGKALLPLSGFAFLWLAFRNWNTAKQGLELRKEGIFDYEGTLVCAFDNVKSVDRSVFAFKPSNGFLVILKQPMPRGWVPGVYWRFGRWVGIGGATPRAQGKQMADILTLLLMEARGDMDSGFGFPPET